SFFSPVPRLTSAILFCAGAAGAVPWAAAPPPPPPPRPPRPPRPAAAAAGGYTVNATQRESPLIVNVLAVPPGAPPRPPPAPPGSPIGNFISFASAAVDRMITDASPSFGART